MSRVSNTPLVQLHAPLSEDFAPLTIPPTYNPTPEMWRKAKQDNRDIHFQRNGVVLEVSYGFSVDLSSLPVGFVEDLIALNSQYHFLLVTPVSFVVEVPMSSVHGKEEMYFSVQLAVWVYANQGPNGKVIYSPTTEFILPARIGNSFVSPDAAVMSLPRDLSVPQANRESNRIAGVPDFAAEIRSASEDELVFLSKCILLVKSGVEFVMGIDSYLQNTHYFCATPAAGVAAVMPLLPAGINPVVVAQPVSLAAVVVDYPAPLISLVPPATINYPAQEIPGVTRATVPWEVSPFINGAGIIAGFQINANNFPMH